VRARQRLPGRRARDESDADDAASTASVPFEPRATEVRWTSADDHALRALFPLYATLTAIAIDPAAGAAAEGGAEEEEDDDDLVVRPLRTAPAAAASAVRGPSLAARILLADRAFSSRAGGGADGAPVTAVSAAAIDARAAALGLAPAAPAVDDVDGAITAKQARIVASAKAALAALNADAPGQAAPASATAALTESDDAAWGGSEEGSAGRRPELTVTSPGTSAVRFLGEFLARVGAER
jgi:hypothetical protein